MLAVVGVGVAACVLVSALPLTRWAYADWVAVSATTREALVYAGPWLSAWCAWVAGRYLGPRSLLCPPSAVRSGRGIVGPQLCCLVAAAAAGYLVGLAPMFGWTTRHATYGSLDLLVFAGSVAVLLLFAALGYVVGCGAPRMLSVVVAVVLAYAVILAADTCGSVVAPLRLTLPVAGQHESGVVALFRVALFVALGAALVVVAQQWVVDRAVVRSPASIMVVGILVVPLAVGGVVRAADPAAVSDASVPPATCTRTPEVEVCVHTAKASLLQPLAATVDRLLGTVGDRPALPISVVRDAALGRDQSAGVVVLDLQTDDSDWRQWAAGDIAGYLAGLQICQRRGDLSGDAVDPALDHQSVADGFARWMASTVGFDPPQLGRDGAGASVADALRAMPTGQAASLYGRLSPQLATCTAVSSDLP